MSLIESLSQPAWQPLGWTLIHFLWQGAAIALLACAAARGLALKRGPMRYALYLAAFTLMAACPVATFVVLDRAASATANAGRSGPQSAVLYEPRASASGPNESPDLLASAPLPSRLVADPDGTAPLRSRLVAIITPLLPYLLTAWLIGATVLSLRLTLAFAALHRLRRTAIWPEPGVTDRVRDLSQRLGLGGFCRVLTSTRLNEPIALGLLRPAVLIPLSMVTELPPRALEAVIAHELAHIRRHDLWVNLLQRVVEALLFFHPAVWWLSGRIRAEREICCDAMAVQATGEPIDYAETLERLATASSGTGVPPVDGRDGRPTRHLLAAALTGRRTELLDRVRQVLGLTPTESRPTWWPAGLLCIVLISIIIAACASQKQRGADGVTAANAQRASDSAVGKAWYYDTVTKEYFTDKTTRIAPFKRDNGNEAVRAHFFTCGECTDDQRFIGYYEKYTDEVKKKLEQRAESFALYEMAFQGRLYSKDGRTWFPAEQPQGTAITAELQKKCPPKTLRYCPPGSEQKVIATAGTAWFYDVTAKEYFTDTTTRIAPFKRDNGNEAVRAHFFTCGQCTDDQRFIGYYEKYSDEVKSHLDQKPDAVLRYEVGFQGRLYSTDGQTWVPADKPEGSAITTALQQKCPPKTLRYCPPNTALNAHVRSDIDKFVKAAGLELEDQVVIRAAVERAVEVMTLDQYFRLVSEETSPKSNTSLTALLRNLLDLVEKPEGRNLQRESELIGEVTATLGGRRVAEAEPVLRRMIPKHHPLFPRARGAAIWALGMIHDGKPDDALATELVERLFDQNPLDPEAHEVRLQSAIALGRMKAVKQLQLLRNRYEYDGLEIRAACRWAIMNITGEELPPITLDDGRKFELDPAALGPPKRKHKISR